MYIYIHTLKKKFVLRGALHNFQNVWRTSKSVPLCRSTGVASSWLIVTLSRGKSAEIGSNLRRKMFNEDHGHLQVHGLCILGTYEMNIDYINTLYINIDLSYIDLLCFFKLRLSIQWPSSLRNHRSRQGILRTDWGSSRSSGTRRERSIPRNAWCNETWPKLIQVGHSFGVITCYNPHL